MKAHHRIIAVLLCAAAHAAQADESADRDRLKAERVDIEARYAARAQACQNDFFVTSCVDAAHAQRREALERVRLQQEALDDAQRKRRAADRLRRIHGKLGEQSAAAAAPLREPRVRQPKGGGGPETVMPLAEAGSITVAAVPAAPASSFAVRAPRAAGHQAAGQARQEEAAKHRAAVEEQRAQRAARHKRAAPLPVPAAASEPDKH